MKSPSSPLRSHLLWQVPLLIAVSVTYESLFVHTGINRLDESWPLYSAMRMHAGGVLYDDVLWVFPPAHLLPAWFAWWLDSPGYVLSRSIYAGFDVALCVALLFLGRRLMPPSFAFLGAMLVAVAAPRSHSFQVLFGYRYLVLSVLGLLFYARRLSTRDSRWMLAAGLAAGAALAFRLTPAFAVSCGIGVAVVTADNDWRRWTRDWCWYAAGLMVVILPILAWFSGTVGLPKLWHEVVVHPLGMLQPLPPPEIGQLDWGSRKSIYRWFVAIQFRTHWVLYAGYGLSLAALWLRARAAGRRFSHPLLLAVVIWGGIYFIRSLGRSDESHLDSAIPPVCFLFAHLLSVGFGALWRGTTTRWGKRVTAESALCAAAFAAWVFLLGTDLYLDPLRRGVHVVQSAQRLGDTISVTDIDKARQIDRVVRQISNRTEPDSQILNLSETPIFHVLSGRTGPGNFDIVIPGTFMTEEEEIAFVEQLKASPPAAVIWPGSNFDDMPSRSVRRHAPRLSEWALSHYRIAGGKQRRWFVWLLPEDERPASGRKPTDARHEPIRQED